MCQGARVLVVRCALCVADHRWSRRGGSGAEADGEREPSIFRSLFLRLGDVRGAEVEGFGGGVEEGVLFLGGAGEP